VNFDEGAPSTYIFSKSEMQVENFSTWFGVRASNINEQVNRIKT